MKIISTICSKDKDESLGLLPAVQRYISSRIANVFDTAKKEGSPFYILSGEYGLIPADYPIPYYDHQLKMEEVNDISRKIVGQIKGNGITEIVFYGRSKDGSWKPYYEALEKAAEETNTFVTTIDL